MTNKSLGTEVVFDFEAVFEVDDYLYFYSEDLTDERTEEEIAALVSLAELEEPMQILDLACGFGRHANRLAALGHKVIGVDLTPGFLDIARRDAETMAVDVIFQQGDMRQIDYQAQFDRVLLGFTSFGYFDDEENLEVLRRIERALKPGGLFIFDIQNRDGFLKVMLPFIVTEKEDNLMIERLTFDSQTGRLQNRRIVIRDGERRDKPFTLRMYNPNEIKALLETAGLEVYKMFGGFDAQPISTKSTRMVIIARK